MSKQLCIRCNIEEVPSKVSYVCDVCLDKNYKQIESNFGKYLPIWFEHGDNRPLWKSYFIGLALVIARRSHDIHTKCGCVIVDKDNHIIGTGYNGFPKGLPDDELPRNRPVDGEAGPSKHDWMIHAERNAVSNCVLKPVDAIAYVTHPPCHDCLLHLWQNNIHEVYYKPNHLNAERYKLHLREKMPLQMRVCSYSPDLSWLCGVFIDA